LKGSGHIIKPMDSKSVKVEPVKNNRDLKEFINILSVLYRDDPVWVPPLWSSEYREYRDKKNAVLAHSEYELFLARQRGKVVGRVIVYVDHNFNKFYKTRTGFFGAFECTEESQIGAALLEMVEVWLDKRGMTNVRGPIDPVAEKWGFVVDGFDRDQVFMSPHNPPYYNQFLESYGYSGVKDLLVYSADMGNGYRLPDRFEIFSNILLKRKPNLSVRRIDPLNIGSEAEYIWKILNTAVSGNWGFVPVEIDEVKDLVNKLKAIVDPDAIWFVEDDGVPVGCALGFPDINRIIKKNRGHMLPFGFIRFITGLKKIKDYRLWALAVLEEYQGMGLDVLLYVKLYKALLHKGIRMEANYILEDNVHIKNALEKLGMVKIKKYRVYEKIIQIKG
jgi:ribosomal protein S18 acetylase RimI-like enzyme